MDRSSPSSSGVPQAPSDPAWVFCRQCGERISHPGNFCTRCGAQLDTAVAQTVYVAKDPSGIEGMIPLNNPRSLWAYYMGIVALIPVVGFFLSIPALIAGITGRNMAKTLPNHAGRLHSWSGILMGGFSLVAHLSVLSLYLLARLS